MNRLNVFTGHYGSGKTEIAINFAKKLKDEGKEVTLVDLDIVNPYFCARDIKKELEDYGVRVIAMNPDLANAELMLVVPEVNAAFDDKSRYVVMDVGGDDSGAIVLGQYNRFFKEEPYSLFFVINNNRIMTDDRRSTKEYMESIEMTSRLKVTNLVSNTNLSYETDAEDILRGDKITKELSEQLNLPYSYTVVRRDLADEVKGKVSGEILPIDIYMKPPWR